MNTCGLIFPHQLFPNHPCLSDEVEAVYVEDSLFFGDARWPAQFHKQKLVFHRASMKAHVAEHEKRRPKRYFDYEANSTINEIIGALHRDGCRRIIVVDPVDDVLERRIEKACKHFSVQLDIRPSPMFLSPQNWAQDFLQEKPPYRMGSFYIAQRKRMQCLVRQGRPEGDAWSHDKANRKKWPKHLSPPPLTVAQHNSYLREAIKYVEDKFPNNPGHVDDFIYPVTRADALTWLDQFVTERLNGFGTYQDAIVERESVLHHSLLSPMLNTGLLTPQEVVDAALKHAERHAIALNDLEGFIRQVIGWREFMMLMYRSIGVRQRSTNFWGHQRTMPNAFYTATTGIEPVDHCIRKVLDSAYCHHIERLMVLGNFMLLCEIHPDSVYRWFMELFIDSYDWVMVPNVYGMSQFADGGLVCTKPYISSSNYIRKMSDFAPGPWCAIWDALFWRFITLHQDFFSGQPRLSMMARQLERMDASKRERHMETAEKYIEQLHRNG